MSERGPENIGFVENFSKSSVLYEKFRKAEVIGEKTPEQKNVANLKVEEILSTSFPVPYQNEGQRDNVAQYKSVVGMIEVYKNDNLTEIVKKTAESALFEVGLALSQNKEVLKAATEGSEELNKILPSSLHEIQPYILSTILTDGKNDVEGQELVSELVDIFKMKKKADTIHGKTETDYKEKKDSFLSKLYDKSEEATSESVEGRIQTMMGYVMGLDENTSKINNVDSKIPVENPVVKNEKNDKVINDNETGEITDSMLEGLGLKRDDEMWALLKDKTNNPALAEFLNYQKKVKEVRQGQGRYEVDLPSGGVEELLKWLDFIEKGSSSPDDLTRNADYYKVLYRIQNGVLDEKIKKEKFNGKVLGEEGLNLLKEEIGMRMLLHEFQLAAFPCKTVEDIMRAVLSTHKGDRLHDYDYRLTSFILKKGGTGLDNYPIDRAWDFRQKGYFRIEFLKDEMSKSKFLDYLKNSISIKDITDERKNKLIKLYEELTTIDKRNNKTQWENITTMKDSDIAIEADPNYGIVRKENHPGKKAAGVYKNFYLIEGERGTELTTIKEYMLWQMLKERGRSNLRTEDNYIIMEKAYDLAKNFSVATFADSKAKISFPGDEYNELLLFKLFRYNDGPGRPIDKPGKSKGVGPAETIRYVDSLTCHWLDSCRRDPSDEEEKKGVGRKMVTIYTPLYSKDIDFNKISGKTDMPYHFGGIVSSQVLAIQEAYYSKSGTKDVMVEDYLNKLFAKINKTTSNMIKAGVTPLYFDTKEEYDKMYSGVAKNPNKTDSEKAFGNREEERICEQMRKLWVVNLFERAKDPFSDWTEPKLKLFINALEWNHKIYNEEGIPGRSFISEKEVQSALKMTGVSKKVRYNNDQK